LECKSRKSERSDSICIDGKLTRFSWATNTTVWETKEDMDAYYSNDMNYQMLLRQIKPMMEEELERREYTIFKAKMKESH
jgi:hypothetical protein